MFRTHNLGSSTYRAYRVGVVYMGFVFLLPNVVLCGY